MRANTDFKASILGGDKELAADIESVESKSKGKSKQKVKK
jgi:hypothetical protein